jgi:hypothetical protein
VIGSVLRFRCGNVKTRASIDCTHQNRLSSPVLGIILNDTKGIDPDILETELSCDRACILEGLAEFSPWNSVLKIGKIALYKLEDVRSPQQ